MTIRTRLALWYSGLLILFIILFSSAILIINRVTTVQMVDRWLAEVAETIVTYIEIETEDMTATEVVRFRSSEMTPPTGISFQLWHTMDFHTGEIIQPSVIFDSLGRVENISPLNPNALTPSKALSGNLPINNFLERVYTRPVYVSQNDNRLVGVVQVATPIQSIMQANRQLLIITVITAAICIGISIGLGLALSHHALKPVRAVTKAATNLIEQKTHTQPLPWHGPKDELGELTEVFNKMLGQLAHLIATQKKFIDDVSHELRTPLASILGNLELMNTYGVQQESVEAIQQEALRLNRMINDVLLLTRAEAGELTLEFYPIDLDSIAVAVFKATVNRTKKRGLSIMMDRVQSVEMVGNGERIHQLISNLMHNATKFTPDSGMIVLSVYAQHGEAIIEVRDTGIGIPAGDLAHIFDRFFKGDESRRHWDDTDGAGLGLSIVQWIVNAHQGKIEVQSEVNKGALFRVRLPLDLHPTNPTDSKLDDTDVSGLKPS